VYGAGVVWVMERSAEQLNKNRRYAASVSLLVIKLALGADLLICPTTHGWKIDISICLINTNKMQFCFLIYSKSASCWSALSQYITMHGSQNVLKQRYCGVFILPDMDVMTVQSSTTLGPAWCVNRMFGTNCFSATYFAGSHR
jgi:hypothetical protein